MAIPNIDIEWGHFGFYFPESVVCLLGKNNNGSGYELHEERSKEKHVFDASGNKGSVKPMEKL